MSGTRGGPPGPGPDGRHDDLLPDELDGLTFGVPDDPRELAADLESWRHDESGDESGAASGPLPDRRAARRRRLTITAGVVLVSMVIVALSGAIGAWIVAPQAAPPPAAPLASAAPEAGQLGGLLPDVQLSDEETVVSSRSLRPAVVLLVPDQCPDCLELLSTAAPQVASFGILLVVVGDDTEQVAELVDAVGPTRLTGLTDPSGALRAAYELTGPTLLLVRDDGVVVDIVSNPVPEIRLEGAMVDLVPATST